MKRRFQLILILLIPIKLNVFSQSDYQKGYVQINEKDTIFGLINYKSDESNHEVCFFKKTENDAIQKFLPEKTFGYKYIDSKYYVSKKIATKNGYEEIFVEYLLKGSINLFFYRDVSDHYLLQKDEMPIKEISYEDEIIYSENTAYYRDCMINRGLIKFYLQDCPKIFGDIDMIKSPSHNELINLIKKYHDIKCPNDVCIIYKKKLPKFRIDIQGIAGIHKSVNSDFGNQYGIFTYIWMPLTNERFFFKSGFLVSNVNTDFPLEFDMSGDTIRKDNYSYKIYSIPFQLQYITLRHRISPTWGFGFNLLLDDHDKSSFLLSSINLGANLRLSEKLYVSLFSELNFLFVPTPKYLISEFFNLGLTIKI